MRIKEVNIVNFKGFQNETVTFNGTLRLSSETTRPVRPPC